MTETAALLACPFCGGEATLITTSTGLTPSDSIPPSVPAELAAPEDVASMLNHLRLSKFSIDRCIADVLEATVRENGNLATRNRALEGENAALAARCEKMQAAIDELVACKDLKDELESDLIDPMPWSNARWRDLQADYERRKPLAWAAARALASQAEAQPTEKT